MSKHDRIPANVEKRYLLKTNERAGNNCILLIGKDGTPGIYQILSENKYAEYKRENKN